MYKLLPKKIPLEEIQADLKSIESELNEVLKIKGKTKREEWAKNNPEKWKKISAIVMKYDIQYAIEVLEELYAYAKKKFAKEKAYCEAILNRRYLPLPDC